MAEPDPTASPLHQGQARPYRVPLTSERPPGSVIARLPERRPPGRAVGRLVRRRGVDHGPAAGRAHARLGCTRDSPRWTSSRRSPTRRRRRRPGRWRLAGLPRLRPGRRPAWRSTTHCCAGGRPTAGRSSRSAWTAARRPMPRRWRTGPRELDRLHSRRCRSEPTGWCGPFRTREPRRADPGPLPGRGRAGDRPDPLGRLLPAQPLYPAARPGRPARRR